MMRFVQVRNRHEWDLGCVQQDLDPNPILLDVGRTSRSENFGTKPRTFRA